MKALRVLFLVPSRETRSLLSSVIDELRRLGVDCDTRSYLPTKGLFFGVPPLRGAFRNQKFDVVVVLDLGYLSGRVVRNAFPESTLVLFAGDTPQSLRADSLGTVLLNFIRNIFRARKANYLRKIGLLNVCKYYDLVLASDPRAVDEFQESGAKSYWFPYWTDQDKVLDESAIKNLMDFDLVTVMTRRPERVQFIRELETSPQLNFRCWSDVANHDIPAVYASGLAVLNHSSFGEVTIRFFEAFASGRVVLTNELDRKSGLKELFQENKHYFVYRDVREIEEILTNLKLNPNSALALGQEARSLVRDSHSASARASQLLRVLEEHHV